MKKAKTAAEAESMPLEALPNVGSAVAADLRLLGLHTPVDLKGQDPYVLYQECCARTGVIQDPCLLDTFIAVTRFMAGDPALPWWRYTRERQKAVNEGALSSRSARGQLDQHAGAMAHR